MRTLLRLGGVFLLLLLILHNSTRMIFRSNEIEAPTVPGVEAQANGADWPQVQRTPQRTGYTSEQISMDVDIAWTHPFQPEKIYPQVQAIVYGGRVFVGTEMGTLHALDAATGTPTWQYDVGSPILSSVAAGGDRVFVSALDGAVYALNAADGALAWRAPLTSRTGFSTAPALVDDTLFLGSREGIFYALNTDDGSVRWQYDVGAPLLQTAAYADGRVYFGAMDLRVYALNASNGTLAWRSDRLDGMAFKDYWPVVHAGRVVVRVMGVGDIDPGFPFNWFSATEDWNWLNTHGPTIAAGNLTSIADAMNAQDVVLSDYQANPGAYTLSLHILDADTGNRSVVVPHWGSQTMNGATTPPCVDRDGLLIVPTYFIRSGWGRLDLSSGRIVDILYDGYDTGGGAMDPGDMPAGMGNRDENMNLSCAGNAVIALHTQEYNANYTGIFDQVQRRWHSLRPGHTVKEMSTNTQGGGGNPGSVANGFIYHITYHELVARQAE